MSKSVYFTMIWIWLIWWIIIYFQNTMINQTLYTPFWPKASSMIIIYSLILWIIAWFWICWVIQSKDDDYENEHF